MQAQADQHARLPIEQAALLWCMRIWVMNLHKDVAGPERIQRMAAQLDASEAAPYIDGFMFALQHGATRTIAIDCVCCNNVSADERALLNALGLAQERRTFEALLVLRGLLTPEGARAAMASAEGIGTSLARVGRFLPAPDAAVGQFAHAIWPLSPCHDPAQDRP